ncbi:MAG: hypothetical protein IJ515_01475 [Clostridia bacterium]|nr:hypothetical protein [Clostridia bacterium]
MKKRLLNDVNSVVLLSATAIGFLLALIGAIASDYSVAAKAVVALVFGAFLLLNLIGFVWVFEIIELYDDKIISRKLCKKVDLLYNEITAIREIDKLGMGVGGTTAVWEIEACGKPSVCIARTKKRKEIIELIKQKSNL